MSKWVGKVSAFAERRVPAVRSVRRYTGMAAVGDVVAGVTLGLTLVPQSIAYAALADLPAQYGLYSAFVGTMVYAFFGNIKEVSIGPTSLMSLLTLHFCGALPHEYVMLLAFLAGIVVMIMGLLRLGFLVELISAPVSSAFTSATSIIIIVSQLKGLLGIRIKGERVVEILTVLWQRRSDTRYQDVILGLVCCVVLLALRQLKDIPAKNSKVKKALWLISISRNGLVVFATATIAYQMEKWNPVPFLLSSKVPSGLPSFAPPPFSLQQGNTTVTFLEMSSNLGSGIVVVPIVMILANIAIAKAFASDRDVDATQEMLTLGLCNVLGACFGAMPVCGAFTRSAISHSSGVRTPLSGIYAGLITMGALSFLTPYFVYIPRATLSAVLICAVAFMIDVSICRVLWQWDRRGLAAFALTLLVSLVFGVELGLMAGMLAGAAHLLYVWAAPPNTVQRLKSCTGAEYVKVTPAMGLFYLGSERVKTAVLQAAAGAAEGVLPIALDCSKLSSIDYTACKTLESLLGKFQGKMQKLILYKAPDDVIQMLEATTNLDRMYFAIASESDLLEVLFCQRDDLSRVESVPLLADAFRKKDSIASVNSFNYELENVMANRHLKVNIRPSKSIESIPEEVSTPEFKIDGDGDRLEDSKDSQVGKSVNRRNQKY